jgi:hypothetical protein
VEKEHGVALSLVDEVHPEPVLLEVVRGEVVAGKAFELLVGCAVGVHDPMMTWERGAG